MSNKFSIPRLSYDELRQRADAIKPVVRGDGDGLFYIKQPDLSTVAFTWDPIKTGPAEGLVEVTRIYTLHTFAYYGFFKPSIAEVLSQIPADIVGQVKAFEVLGPNDAEDLNDHSEQLNAGFHVAETILYQ